METNVLAERRRFVRDMARGDWTMSALCALYGISRPCGHKWWARYQAEGEAGLQDQSRAPHECPHRTTEALERQIVAARRKYGWGAKKLLTVLRGRQPHRAWPARSTVNDVLDRHELLEKRRRRRTWPRPPTVVLASEGPNHIWPVDFKGQFKTGDGQYCYPLTVTDHFSRRILAVQGLAAISTAATRRALERLFRELGLPAVIRSDNGSPFASSGLQGLSALSVWWMQLGITHQRTRPAHPQDNGSHERMHRELKRETTRPPAAHLRGQQRRFDAFRQRYNAERPHEALHQRTPDTAWRPSPRPYPTRINPPEYPGHWEVRRVTDGGAITLHQQPIYLTRALEHQLVGLEEIDDGCWRVVYYQTVLGAFDETTGQMTGIGRIKEV